MLTLTVLLCLMFSVIRLQFYDGDCILQCIQLMVFDYSRSGYVYELYDRKVDVVQFVHC